MKKPIHLLFNGTLILAGISVLNLAACSWVDSTGRQNNELPEIRASINDAPLEDKQALVIEDSGSLDLDFSASEDPDGLVVSFNNTLIDQGKLAVCDELIKLNEAANLIGEACDTDVSPDDCNVTIVNRGEALGDSADPDSNADSQFMILPPPLIAPIGLTYRWTATDNDGGETSMDLTFCLESASDLPVANDDLYHLAYNSEINITGVTFDDNCQVTSGSMALLANDEDNFDNASCIQAELVTPPQSAANDFMTEFTATGGFRYVHDGSFSTEADSFTYRLTDGEFVSETATVSLDINFGSNQTPIANDDEFYVGINSSANSLDVTENDLDPELYPLTLSAVGQPDQGGSVSIDSTGQVSYTPATDFFGTEVFAYTVTDAGNASSDGQVTVYVSDANAAPIAVDDIATAEAGQWVFFRLLSNDSDPNPEDEIRIVDVTKPDMGGRVVIDARGEMVFYRAHKKFTGIETFTYTIEDDEGASSTATVTVTVLDDD